MTLAPQVEATAKPDHAGSEGAGRPELMGSALSASNRTPVSASRLEERDSYGALALEAKFVEEQPFQTSWIVRSPGGRCCTTRTPAELPRTPGAHLGISTDRGRLSSYIRFRTLHAINASVACASAWRARSRPAMVDFIRKKVFSTRPWR